MASILIPLAVVIALVLYACCVASGRESRRAGFAETKTAKPESTVREVKRPAKPGEYIKIVQAWMTEGLYQDGDVLLVDRVDSDHDVYVKFPSRDSMLICYDEYVVLENYQPHIKDSLRKAMEDQR